MQPHSENSAIRTGLRQLGFDAESICALPGDVSPRAYSRVVLRGGGTAIASYYPEEIRETQRRFAITTQLLTQARVRVPRVFANSPELGVMVVEDLGGKSLFEVTGSALGSDRGRAAATLAQRISTIAAESVQTLNAPLDGALLRRELDQTWAVALQPLGLMRDSAEGVTLDRALAAVCDRLGSMVQTACHRDFMVRNLMVLESGEIGVLDHQDLRLGPKGYDFASLTCDSASCSLELRKEIRQTSGIGEDDFDRLVAQRTFKIVGTFHAFAQRGFPIYLRLVPSSLADGLEALLRLPEGAALESLGFPELLLDRLGS